MYSTDNDCCVFNDFTGFPTNASISTQDIKDIDSPDCAPMLSFNRLCNNICIPLEILFNQSLSSSIFLKRIFLKTRLSNTYLQCWKKHFEKIVANKIIGHVEHHLNPAQHGFRAKSSSESNLLEYVILSYGLIQEL